jgi:hypothetical protein
MRGCREHHASLVFQCGPCWREGLKRDFSTAQADSFADERGGKDVAKSVWRDASRDSPEYSDSA